MLKFERNDGVIMQMFSRHGAAFGLCYLHDSYHDYNGGDEVNSANVPRDGSETEVAQQVLGKLVGKGVRAVHPF